MADSSFDIVSKVDRQEVDNALNQAAKELSQRFDFKNTSTTIEWKGELAVEITSSTEERAAAALEVFRDKLVKRQLSLKSVLPGDDLMLITANGMIIRTGLDEIRSIGRNTQGVRLIKLKEDDKLVAAEKIAAEDLEAEEGEAGQ